MVEEHTKNKLMMIELMLVVLILIFVGAFAIDRLFPTGLVSANTDTAPIVGFVPIEIKSQPIDLFAPEPTSFVIFSEKEDEFDLTSLRMTGEVTGKGRAEILLDNGLGQELIIYSNVKKKQGNIITGMAITEEGEPLPESAEISEVDSAQAWLKISPGQDKLNEEPGRSLEDDQVTVEGAFQNACVDTCYMNMKLKKGLYYTLKVRVDPGTEVRINELKYTLEV